ncbi:MAG: PD-(D/E)XK nuclease family protein [Saprospiraceae bacterium]|nr:PD-(D/E)XK nuclease family protein [Saprospiraceae bacterium]
MIIQFGLELEERTFPQVIKTPQEVTLSCGVNGLMNYLEKHLGIHYLERHDYLRYEQYRQILLNYLERNPDVFFAASFKADNMATSIALLELRDELYLGGWDFNLDDNMPTRLCVLAELEQLIEQTVSVELFEGFAERFRKIIHFAGIIPIPLKKIYLNEPLNLLPPHIQELFRILEDSGIELETMVSSVIEKSSDLQVFQKALLKQKYIPHQVKADGSLIILKAKRDTFLAEYLAKLFQKNPNYHPVCLIPDKNRVLDISLIEEGLPSMGILSASLARPTLQILKLVSTFLWKPINPYKILEFVSLPNTPIHPVLARGVAKIMAEKPGLFSNEWNTMVREFFDYYDNKIEENPEQKSELEIEREEAQQQYLFWFNRKRYDINKSVPKKEVIVLFNYVFRWARKELDKNINNVERFQKLIDNPATTHQQSVHYESLKEDMQNVQPALDCLCSQSINIVQVLEALPENDLFLSNLRLERLVRTINEPVGVRFRSEELGHLPYVYKSSSVVRPIDHLLWWNFVDVEQKIGFAKWYNNELAFLKKQSVNCQMQMQKNERLLWQRMQAILKTQKKLILVMPSYIEGKEQLPHPLWGDLCAAMGEKELNSIIVNIDTMENIDFLSNFFVLPEFEKIQLENLGKPQPYFHISSADNIQKRETESFSSLDSLLYYPYKWLFKYQAKFHKSTMLSVTKDNRLKGNIAHSVFERLFNAIKISQKHWLKEEVLEWVDQNITELFDREGAVLLMYGQEPERIGLIHKIKYAAWSLVSSIQANNWEIEATESKISGKIVDKELKGFVDLVLTRGNEKAIVDLKWGGASYRKDQYRNKTDLQLVIYSKFLEKKEEWAHTAFFIIESGKLIARNNLAFKEAEAISPDLDFREIHQEIWHSLEKTYKWRMDQISLGKVEVRTEDTHEELEELIREEFLDSDDFWDLLEMKSGNAKFDDYQVLINLTR